MINRKNISPGRLALVVSSIIAVVAAILSYLYTSSVRYGILSLLLLGLISYGLIYYVLQEFIYRKVKLIYKFISNTKASQREEFYNLEILPQKTLEEVNDDVEKWATDRKGEIERLESNEQFRKEFLMNLAHELKTPIFATQGYIDTLLDGALHDNQVNETFLQNASKSIDRLADLVNDLDVISKFESNRIPIHKREFTIQELVKDVYAELSQKASKKGIKLSIKKGCESPLEVFADNQKIKQVLINLVENSIKYGRENGETTAGFYEVDDKTIYIEISDNGIGIAEEQVLRVFERFFRTDSARSRSDGGTGLGLAIVKHIIEAHNHTVVCRSTIDVGSSFGFTLDKALR
ncbi:MAG: sensor histidine kinase [Bacteroidetes bacterium]|nr:sensor histidine kinase [Bacteroidota bacterium]